MSFDHINKFYGVNAYKGRRVRYEGKLGTIVGFYGSYIKVHFDGDHVSIQVNFHPTWKMEYIN